MSTKRLKIFNKNLFVIVDSEDYQWLSKKKWRMTSTCNYPSRVSRNGRYRRWIKMHTAIWEYHHGKVPPGMQIDHIDGNPLNNSLSNLQLLTPKENCAKRHMGNQKGVQASPIQQDLANYMGVQWNWDGRNYSTKITVNDETHDLGSYDSPQQAAMAYDLGVILIKRCYATEQLNFPELHDADYRRMVNEIEPFPEDDGPPWYSDEELAGRNAAQEQSEPVAEEEEEGQFEFEDFFAL